MKSITRRWIRTSLLITILVLLFAEVAFLYLTATSYYDTVRRSMLTRISAINTQLAVSADTPDGRSVALRRMVEQFSEKDKFEFMLIDSEGHIVTSTTGFTPQEASYTDDYTSAINQQDGVGQAIYKTPANEQVMAITTMLPKDSGDIIAFRLVTSLDLLNQNILSIALISLFIVGMIIVFSVWSGIFFIRGIVRPIAAIEATATKIAHGNLDVRIENKFNDEIGSLCNTINSMASELGRNEKMKNEFISSVSHELRTPLTSIKSWAETMEHMQPTDVGFKRGIDVIRSESDRLYNMVEELLDFSRMQHGITLNPELLDLVAEVSDIVLMMEKRAMLDGVTLEYDEPELPVPIMGDTNRLKQVFVNIIDNAIKYSHKGGNVKIEILQDGQNAFVNISDNGQGIAAEDLENVKLKFYKGSGSVRGSGIGLAVVDEISKAHHGSLTLQSELGKGTTATIRLPLKTNSN